MLLDAALVVLLACTATVIAAGLARGYTAPLLQIARSASAAYALGEVRVTAAAAVSLVLHLLVAVVVALHAVMLASLRLGNPHAFLAAMQLLQPLAWSLAVAAAASLAARMLLGTTITLAALDLLVLVVAVTAATGVLRAYHVYIGIAAALAATLLTLLHSDAGARLRRRAAPIPEF